MKSMSIIHVVYYSNRETNQDAEPVIQSMYPFLQKEDYFNFVRDFAKSVDELVNTDI